jgi:hypothetical protein
MDVEKDGQDETDALQNVDSEAPKRTELPSPRMVTAPLRDGTNNPLTTKRMTEPPSTRVLETAPSHDLTNNPLTTKHMAKLPPTRTPPRLSRKDSNAIPTTTAPRSFLAPPSLHHLGTTSTMDRDSADQGGRHRLRIPTPFLPIDDPFEIDEVKARWSLLSSDTHGSWPLACLADRRKK